MVFINILNWLIHIGLNNISFVGYS